MKNAVGLVIGIKIILATLVWFFFNPPQTDMHIYQAIAGLSLGAFFCGWHGARGYHYILEKIKNRD